MRILIIGCGNIGALYDFENDSILTHAKAFSKKSNCKLYFFDLDHTLVKRVANRYQSDYLLNLDDINFNDFDCICICTPTSTHYELLVRTLESNTKLIICEKPISNSRTELVSLKEQYQKSSSRVLVNYIRRFQPDYIWLRNFVQTILAKEELTNISIRYQRGFINNCSHAFDLIAFLTSAKLELENFQKQNLVYDHFEMDPTMSLMAQWNATNINVLGLSNVLFSHFEIDMFFKETKIAVKESGNTIDIFQSKVEGRILNPLYLNEQLSKNNCLVNYMLNVVERAIEMLKNESIEDNFIDSLELNLLMLKYIN